MVFERKLQLWVRSRRVRVAVRRGLHHASPIVCRFSVDPPHGFACTFESMLSLCLHFSLLQLQHSVLLYVMVLHLLDMAVGEYVFEYLKNGGLFLMFFPPGRMADAGLWPRCLLLAMAPTLPAPLSR